MSVRFTENYSSLLTTLSEGQNMPSSAQEVVSETTSLVNNFNSLSSGLSGSSWSGRGGRAFTNKVMVGIRNRFNIFHNNTSGSLLPAANTAINDLYPELTTFKEKDELLEIKLKEKDELDLTYSKAVTNYEKAVTSYNNTSTYIKNKNGEQIYNSKKTDAYNNMSSKLTEKNNAFNACEAVNKTIEELNTAIDKCIIVCNNAMTIIQSKIMTPLSGSLSNGNKEVSLSDLLGDEDIFIYKDPNGNYYYFPNATDKQGNKFHLTEPSTFIYINPKDIEDMLKKKLGDDSDVLNKPYGKTGMTLLEYFISQLENQANNPSGNHPPIFDFSIPHSEKNGTAIALILDQILNDSYDKNNAKTPEERMIIAALTSSGVPLLHIPYGHSGDYTKVQSEGFVDILDNNLTNNGKNKNTLDCIGYFRWLLNQGITGNDEYSSINTSPQITGSGGVHQYSTNLFDPNFKISDLQPGSILTMETGKADHIGMVVGTGIREDGTEVILVSHSSGGGKGVNLSAYTQEQFAQEWSKGAKDLGYNAKVSLGIGKSANAQDSGVTSLDDFFDIFDNNP